MKDAFVYTTRVYYDDTDAGRVMSHARYLNFFERGRTERLAARGVDFGALIDEGCLFVVAKATVNYRKPAKLNDKIDIVTTVAKKGRTFVDYEQLACVSGDMENVYCDALIRVVCVNEAGEPKRFPSELEGLYSE